MIAGMLADRVERPRQPLSLPRGLQPFRNFWLNNHAVCQQYDEKHSLHRATKRVRETEKPMWNWTCDKFLSFNYSGLDVVENSYPVCRNFCRFLLAYGLGHILFVSLENVFKFSTILGSVSISKQLNRDCWNREQESDQDCRKVAHGGCQVGLKEFGSRSSTPGVPKSLLLTSRAKLLINH